MLGISIQEYKGQALTSLALHDCVAVRAELRFLQAEYTHQDLSPPAWVTEKALMLDRRIRDLKRDAQAHELARVTGELARLAPEEEKRAALQQQKAQLEAALATP
jgi:hypothetical protein